MLVPALIGFFGGLGIGAVVIVRNLRQRQGPSEPPRTAVLYGLALITFCGMVIVGAVIDSSYAVAAGGIGVLASFVGLAISGLRWRMQSQDADST